MSDTIETDNPVPLFADPLGIGEATKSDSPRESVSQSDDAGLDDLFRSAGPPPTTEPPKRRGRRPGTPNKATLEKQAREAEAALKKLETSIAGRSSDMMVGLTGLAGMFTGREHLQMTESEADAIAIPLASYMASRYEQVEWVGEVIDRWDLVAVSIGLLTYLIRVWREDVAYRAERAATRNLGGAPRSRREGTPEPNAAAQSVSPRVLGSENPYVAVRTEYGPSSGDTDQGQSPNFPA